MSELYIYSKRNYIYRSRSCRTVTESLKYNQINTRTYTSVFQLINN